MYRGPSQVDLWDPKPELVKHHGKPIPDLDKDPLFKVRNPGTLLATSHKFSKSGQSGIEVSDLYPHLAGRVDDMAIIRSTYADSFAHGSGLLQMNTGFLQQGYPSLGSWVTYGLGTANQNLPAFVVMLDQRGGPITGPPNWSCGFMPATSSRPVGPPPCSRSSTRNRPSPMPSPASSSVTAAANGLDAAVRACRSASARRS